MAEDKKGIKMHQNILGYWMKIHNLLAFFFNIYRKYDLHKCIDLNMEFSDGNHQITRKFVQLPSSSLVNCTVCKLNCQNLKTTAEGKDKTYEKLIVSRQSNMLYI